MKNRGKEGVTGRRGEMWVVAQAVLLLLIVLAPQSGPYWAESSLYRFFGGVLLVAGMALLAWSAAKLGHSLTPFPRPVPEGRLVTSGPYRVVRHPSYLGVLLAACGFAFATANPLRMVLTVLLFVFFDLKARREERWLQEQYPEYAAYKSRVRKLIPGLY
ncbi:methyltransferase family protein [Noviherbaspirillum massiliense]|uniref:methyltransferase family protein n=1 Tax=Noviherbaspirillum massiliense TaxID=1465823 RepID=UPI000474DEB2|nr:isoprenylcysteine carboxylmethyltransferase family protein [Noviherbaspirillum massiliense]